MELWYMTAAAVCAACALASIGITAHGIGEGDGEKTGMGTAGIAAGTLGVLYFMLQL